MTLFYSGLPATQLFFFLIIEDNFIRCFHKESTIHALTSNHNLYKALGMSNFPCKLSEIIHLSYFSHVMFKDEENREK